MRWSFSFLSFLLLGLSETARGESEQPNLESVFLSVEGDSACASEAELFRRLELQIPGIHRAKPGDQARRFRVEFRSGLQGQIIARIHQDAPNGEEAPRELPSHSCDEALQAVVLVLALTVAPAPAPQELSTEQSSPKAAEIERVPNNPTPLNLSKASPSPKPNREAPSPPAPRPRHGEWRPSFRVGAAGHWGLAPAPLVGVVAAVGLVRPSVSPWVPSFTLSLERTATTARNLPIDLNNQRGNLVRISTALSLAQGEICSGRWRSRGLVVEPCLSISGGRIESEATDLASGSQLTASSHGSSSWWGAVGAMVRGRWALGAGFHLELGGGAWLPFQRLSFRLTEASVDGTPPASTTPFRSSWVSAMGELGLSWSRQ